MSTQQTLIELLEIFKNGHADKTTLYRDVALRLSKLVGKSPTWKEDWIQSVANGNQEPSRKLARAVELLAAQVDGQHPALTDLEAVLVYAKPGTVRPGAIITRPSINCAYPPCPAYFVPHHPNVDYCPAHREPKARNYYRKPRK